jgi:cell division septation protein DedD
VVINLALPIAHFWPDGSPAGDEVATDDYAPDVHAAPLENADTAEDRGGETTSPDVAMAESVTPDSAAAGIGPVVVPEVERRVLPAGPAMMCLAWGPFGDPNEAESLAASLALEPDGYEVYEAAERVNATYLVSVAVPGAPEAANEALERLQGAGVDAAYLLSREDGVSKLALGVFSSRARAEQLRTQVGEMALKGIIKELEETRPVYHLMARLPADARPTVEAEGLCNDIAPGNQVL